MPIRRLFPILFLLAACGGSARYVDDAALLQQDWAQTEAAARGQQLSMMMWMGDPYINRYMSEWVKPELKARYGIELEIVSGQGTQIVSTLLAEREAGAANSQLDLVWINGETFFQLRQIGALWGPFVPVLPNAQYLNLENPFIGMDFQQPVDGYECPWGNVQLSLIYNAEKLPQPPPDRAALGEWIKAHPGRFSIATEFTGMTLLKSFLIDIAGGPDSLSGPFEEGRYRRHSAKLWAFLRELKPFFWKNGETFPQTLAQLHQLFASGELWFTMSNNDGEVDNKIAQGLFPAGSRAYALRSGMIQNSHYLGIPAGAQHKAAALVACNFLISPEAQFRKIQPAVWGDGTVLDRQRLPAEWQEKFRQVPGRRHAPSRDSLQAFARMELAPEYMIRLYEDFRSEVVNR